MPMDFTIKRNDTRPRLQAQLLKNVGDGDEEPINLAGAESVLFVMRRASAAEGTAADVSAEADITETSTGTVTYTWVTGDTAAAGVFEAEFQINWSDGGVETVPNDSYIEVTVVDDLNNDD